jgi:hypothetical protein
MSIPASDAILEVEDTAPFLLVLDTSHACQVTRMQSNIYINIL